MYHFFIFSSCETEQLVIEERSNPNVTYKTITGLDVVNNAKLFSKIQSLTSESNFSSKMSSNGATIQLGALEIDFSLINAVTAGAYESYTFNPFYALENPLPME